MNADICIQNNQISSRVLATCFMLFALINSGSISALSLKDAVNIALESDPNVLKHYALSKARANKAIADGTLPDPKLRLGLFNVPTDTFDLDQEPVTQLRLGIQQMFPAGDTLELKQARTEWMSKASMYDEKNARRMLIKDVRETYFNLYYQVQAKRVIKETSSLFSNLVEITAAQYSSGRIKQQDVIRAELELSRLEDRETKILTMEETTRAILAQWIGDAAFEILEQSLAKLPTISNIENLNYVLTEHPMIKSKASAIEAEKRMTDVVRQSYKPGMNAIFEYRKRFGDNPDGTERTDMVAAMVVLDIPLFTANRQDKKVAASEFKTNAARFMRDDSLRNLKRMYDKDSALIQRLKQREKLYKEDLLRSARSHAIATLNSYQAGLTEFSDLMRARITELDVKLSDLKIRVDRAKAHARLLYVTGE